ncbi:MAG: EAL domain-containing protein [Thermoanaerobaculia bacterium]
MGSDDRPAIARTGPDGLLLSVDVPDGWRAPFLRAQDAVARYFEKSHVSPESGTISFAEERYVLVRAASMSVEFFDLVMSLYADRGEDEARRVATNLLFDFAHAIGAADARSFHSRSSVTDPMERLSTGPLHFALTGWASGRLLPESNPQPGDDFVLVYEHPMSFEADSWISQGRLAPMPACVMNAGYSSGWCEVSFGVPLVAAEVECRAAGGEVCRFVMAPPAMIETRIAAWSARSERTMPPSLPVSVPEFFQRKRLEDELERSYRDLESRVEERTAALKETNSVLRREITERQIVEERLRIFESAVEHASEGIVILTPYRSGGQPVVIFANDGFRKLSGLTDEEIIGHGTTVFRIAAGEIAAKDELSRSLREGRAFSGEARAFHSDGREYALDIHVMPVLGGEGRITHWVGILRDVSERKAQVAELQRQALHDVLTTLPNRTLLFDRLEQVVIGSLRTGARAALLLVDLDRFKDVNDTFGHHVGDLLLRQAADRIKQLVRAGDTVARLGGDEFAILLPAVGDERNALRIAQKVCSTLEAPFAIEGQTIEVGGSIGIALCPEHGHSAETLVRRADTAMYLAKRTNVGFAIYAPEYESSASRGQALHGELRRAIDTGELLLHYQPRVDLRTGRVGSVEALVRWRHPDQGLLLPERFINIAERTGLIRSLSSWVLDSALQQCHEWHKDGLAIAVAVNLSTKNLQDPSLAETITSLLEKWELEPESLEIEITESSIMADPQHVAAVLSLLRSLGVGVAIDDFGTGFSSLAHLRELAVDQIKIDKSFVLDIGTNASDRAIVRSTINLAHGLGCRAVAEGVETSMALHELIALGCDDAQGYYISRPLPAEALRRWIDRAPPWTSVAPLNPA